MQTDKIDQISLQNDRKETNRSTNIIIFEVMYAYMELGHFNVKKNKRLIESLQLQTIIGIQKIC